jgi:uncharacterized protein (DUF924 family)
MSGAAGSQPPPQLPMQPQPVLTTPQDVLRFWFGEEYASKEAMDDVTYIRSRMPFWFMRKSPEFEHTQMNHEQLLNEVHQLDLQSGGDGIDSSNGLWNGGIESLMAKVILFDQFPRSIYRGSAKAFAYDQQAVKACKLMVSPTYLDAFNHQLSAIQRLFVNVALQHSEAFEDQILGVELAKTITQFDTDNVDLDNFFKNLPGFPMEHHDVIQRFGRFPSRNEALVGERLVVAAVVVKTSSFVCPAIILYVSVNVVCRVGKALQRKLIG